MTFNTANTASSGYLFGIDRGGTFTDIVAWSPDGQIVARKLLSVQSNQDEDAAIRGIRDILQSKAGEPLPDELIAAVCMGTTVGTNALLEREGTPTAFVATKGFAHAIRIGYQERPRLFDLDIKLPSQLYETVTEIEERLDVNGNVLVELNLVQAREALQVVYDSGIRSCAIALMHSYRFPAHEIVLAELAREIGFAHVTVSHECSGMIKYVGRAETAVVDAYLTPVLRSYTSQLDKALGRAPLFFMQSNGGLTAAAKFRGKDCVLSGPAGGIVGAVAACSALGMKNIIGFDMGGTSTDVSHYAGHFERTVESQIAGARVRSPIMMIHTVAAGGGSIVSFDGKRFRVGPESAGSLPGPAAYRNGGPLTVTDCNVVLGRIPIGRFPKIFGEKGDQPLDSERSNQLFDEITKQVNSASEVEKTKFECAEDFLNIAVENMANAIKKVSTEKGYDITKYTLCCFGGAGGQHACKVAESLGMASVYVPPLAGVLSAFGMGLADLRAIQNATIERVFERSAFDDFEDRLQSLEVTARKELIDQGIPDEDIVIIRRAMIRYEGASSGLEVIFDKLDGVREKFEELYGVHYGFKLPEKGVVFESVTIEAAGAPVKLASPTASTPVDGLPEPEVLERASLYTDGELKKVPVYNLDAIPDSFKIVGPAIVVDPLSTTVVDNNWTAMRSATGGMVLNFAGAKRMGLINGSVIDPALLEIFNNRFMAIADQMGHSLANSAHSVNIKERLDFSCAIFDADRNLIANAPHIPIHLGAMSESVEVIAREFGQTMERGDLFVLNSPYKGGAHLPDVTVIMPVFDAGGSRVLFYTAARGHHADIGGKTPGSLPPDSRTIYEEGALIEPMRLVHHGQFAHDDLRKLLTEARYPARNPDQNIIDMQAQVASCIRGSQELHKLIAETDESVATAYAQYIQDMSETELKAIIDQIPEGEYICRHDSGHHVAVKISVNREKKSIKVDFTGTSAQVETNFNAPPAIPRSATLYVFRTLINRDIPLNAGCLRPIEIVVPEKSLLNPVHPAAVSSGNPETSVLVTDALYGALGIIGGSQGTMNNFTFGNDTYQYYETICGGAGAGDGFDGASAVHTHMTNSRMTDPEVFELRFPVLLEEFSVRRGSGGQGRWRGGDGVTRRVRFLEELQMAIVSNRRQIAPDGAAGGSPGEVGRNRIIRASGEVVELGSCDQATVQPGDVFEILTPGGGGYGKSN